MATRERRYERTLNCEFCGGVFSAASSAAKYCCGAHRLAAKRKRDRLAHEMTKVRYELDRFVNEFVLPRRAEVRAEGMVELGALKIHLDSIINRYAE